MEFTDEQFKTALMRVLRGILNKLDWIEAQITDIKMEKRHD